MATQPTNFVTMKAFAAQRGLSYETVRRLVAKGELPHIRIGKSIRIDMDALNVVSAPPVADRLQSIETPPPAAREAFVEYIAKVVAAAPPLSSDQIARISTLLGTARDTSALAKSA